MKLLKSILSWSEVGTQDWKLRLPEIHEEEQRWFTEEVEKIIEVAEGQYKVLFHSIWPTPRACVPVNFWDCALTTSTSTPEGSG